MSRECTTTAALGEGEWIPWEECASRACLSTGIRSNRQRWQQSAALALNGHDGLGSPPFVPRAWAPHGCALHIFDGAAARRCLHDRHILIVGDSVSAGRAWAVRTLTVK